jgi:hypothetical protein
MIYSLVEIEVRDAITKPKNFLPGGGINWNYVDSDCYMSGVNKYFKDDNDYYETWDEIVDTIVNEMREESNADAQIEMNFYKK